MIVTLAVVSAVLALALVITLVRSARVALRCAEQLADAGATRDALASEVESTRGALSLLERQLTSGRSLTETAEHLRLQREWAELAGPDAALPAAWDASLTCLVVSELEIIREVVGTPSTVETIGGDRPSKGFQLALAAEFLRAAARDADEIRVEVGDAVVVRGSSVGSASTAATPHLDSIRAVVEAAGADIVVDTGEGGFTAKLLFSD